MTKARKSKLKSGDTILGSSWIKRTGRGQGKKETYRRRTDGKVVFAKGKVTKKILDRKALRSKNKEVTKKHIYGFDKGFKMKKLKGVRL